MSLLAEHGAIVLGQKSMTMRRNASEGWSGHHCIGDMDTDLQAHESKNPRVTLTRACSFSNVCWAPATGEWLYYQNDSPQHGEGLPSLATSSGGARRRDMLSLKVVNRREPSGAHVARIRRLTALMGGRFAPNIGHFVWDHAFALLTSMSQLGVYASELNVLRTSACMKHGSQNGFVPELCAALADAFLAPLNGRSPVASPRGWVRTLDELRAAHPTSKRLCFDQLQAGGTYNAFDAEPLNVGREGFIALYRYRVLQWHGLNPLASAASPRILLVRKTGKHADSGRHKRFISNFEEVSEYVRGRFGQHADIRVTSFADMTFADQLKQVTSTSISFSPCGGISMILPFLPHGAHVVLTNYIIRTADPHWVGFHGECAVSCVHRTRTQTRHISAPIICCASNVAARRTARGRWRSSCGATCATSTRSTIAF